MRKDEIEIGEEYAQSRSADSALQMVQNYTTPSRYKIIAFDPDQYEKKDYDLFRSTPRKKNGTPLLAEKLDAETGEHKHYTMVSTTMLVCPWEKYAEKQKKHDQREEEKDTQYEETKEQFLADIEILRNNTALAIPEGGEFNTDSIANLVTKDSKRRLRLKVHRRKVEDFKKALQEAAESELPLLDLFDKGDVSSRSHSPVLSGSLSFNEEQVRVLVELVDSKS